MPYSMNYTTADVGPWLTRVVERDRAAVVRSDVIAKAAGLADAGALSPLSAVTISARATERDKNRPRTTSRPERGRVVGAREVGPNTREGPQSCHLARYPRTSREHSPPCGSAVSSRLPRRRRRASPCKSLGGRTRYLGRKSAPSSTSSREIP